MVLRQLGPAVRITIVLTIILGVIYPLAITGLAQVIFPSQANGSLIRSHGRIVGSSLIGQSFKTNLAYFQSRPSAAGKGYDATASAGSNLAPSNRVLIMTVKERIARLLKQNPGMTVADIPPDLVEASASGLDPDISPAAAYFQVPRIARLRHLSQKAVRSLVSRHVEGRQLGVLGHSRVNVLDLNMALDRLSHP